MPIPSTTRATQSADSLGSQSVQSRVKEVVQPISVKLPPKHLYTCTVGRNRSQARWVLGSPGSLKHLYSLLPPVSGHECHFFQLPLSICAHGTACRSLVPSLLATSSWLPLYFRLCLLVQSLGCIMHPGLI